MVTYGRGCSQLPGVLLVALGLVVACDGLITVQPQLNPSANENSNQVFKFNYTQRGIGSSSNKWPLSSSSSGIISSTTITTTPSPGEQILRQQRQLVAKLKNRLANSISISKVSPANNNATNHEQSNSNSTAINGGRVKNETLTPLAASNSAKLASSQLAVETSDFLGGRKLSRLQPLSKRQTDGSDLPPPSKRNEDPWFLDQQPPYPLQPYRFVYNIKGKNGQTEQYRQEVGDGKYLTGSYGYMLPDGIYRHVDYVADDRGFRAFIRTSEPGTANQNPANVVINSNPVLVSPGVDYAFPTSGSAFATADRSSSLYDGGRQSSSSLYQNNPSTSNFNQPDYSSFANSAFADQPNELRRRPPGSIVNGGANNLSSLIGTSQPIPYASPLPPGSIVNNALRNFNSYTDSTSKSLLGLSPLRNFTSFTYGSPQPGAIVNNELRNFNSNLSLPTSTNYFSLGGGGGGGSGSLGPRNASKWSADDGRGGGSGGSTGSGNPPESADDNLGLSYKSISGPQLLSNADLWRRQQGQRQYQETHGLLPFNRGFLQPQQPAITTQAPSITLIRRPPLASTPFESRAPSSGDGSSRLSYDKPLADQRYHAGPHKLSYDNNHIFHPDSPYLTLERARNLAHLEQSNGFPRNHYLTSGGLTFGPGLLGTLIPTTSTISGAGGGVLLTPLGGRSGEGLRTHQISKQEEEQEEHHQAHHHSSHSSEQIGVGPPLVTVTSKEHHSGTKSASGNEFESRQTIGSGDHLLPPPAPQFDHNLAPDGGTSQPSSSLQAKFQSRPVESANDHNFFNIKGGGRSGLGLSRLQAPYTSNLNPQQQPQLHSLDPRPPSSPEEPREPVEVSSTPLPPQLEPPQTGGGEQPVGGDSTDEQQQQRGRSDVKGGGGGGGGHGATRRSSVGESSWLGGGGQVEGAGNIGQPRFVHRPVREPENFRSAMMMGDFRSMQNTIGLPQPPRLAAGGSIGERTDERLGAGLNRADRIISARLSQIEALVSGSHQGTGELHQARPTSSETSESRRDEKPAQALSLLAGGPKQGKQQQQRPPEQRLTQTGEGATEYDRKLSTGPLTKGNLGISGDPFNQLLLAGGVANETFDARRLTSAAKLQAERVSELEKFQQRLRTQQLLLGGAGSGNNNLHGSSKQSHQKAGSAGRARAGGELNSQVKFDEEPDVAFHSVASTGADGINRSPRASTSGDELSHKVVKHPVANSTSNLAVQTNRPAATGGSALSDLAQKLRAWPSLIQATNNRTTSVNQAESASRGIDSNASGSKSKDSQDKLGGRSPGGVTSNTQSASLGPPKVLAHVKLNDTKPANTINLDFINSVTALSVDQMNPFAIASVNPALQQQQQQSRQLGPDSRPLSKRDGQEEASTKSTDRIENTGAGGARGSPAGGIATSNARYFNSPELLAALDYHERRDTSSQMRSLLPQGDGAVSSGDGRGGQTGSGISRGNLQSGGDKSQSTSSWASNHRFSGAPYMMLSATSSSASRTSAAAPVPPNSVASSSSLYGPSPTHPTNVQDEFEVRDRSVQVDNHRFYEVVSSIAPVLNPRVQGDGYAAFRDAQLSIPAAS